MPPFVGTLRFSIRILLKRKGSEKPCNFKRTNNLEKHSLKSDSSIYDCVLFCHYRKCELRSLAVWDMRGRGGCQSHEMGWKQFLSPPPLWLWTSLHTAVPQGSKRDLSPARTRTLRPICFHSWKLSLVWSPLKFLLLKVTQVQKMWGKFTIPSINNWT